MNTIKNFFGDETGFEVSEYAVAASLVALAVVATLTALGERVSSVIQALAGEFFTSRTVAIQQ